MVSPGGRGLLVEGGAVTLAEILRGIRARWALVLTAVILGAVVSGGIAIVIPKTYVATATIALRWIGPDPGIAELANARYLTREAETVALLAQRPDVLESAATQLGVSATDYGLADRVEAKVPLDSQLVRVTGSAGRPGEAAELATAVAEAVVTASAGGATSQNVDTVLAVAARSPRSPVAPRLPLYLAAGLLAGLVAGVAGALIASRGSRAPQSMSAASVQPAHVVWVLLVAAAIPWRVGSFYEGGFDPVVLAKAGLSVAALGASAVIATRAQQRYSVAALPPLFIGLYLVVTLIGGIANDATAAAMVVAVRMAILAVTVCLLAVALPSRELARTLVHVLAVLMTMGALSGLPSYSGRLRGVIPLLNPNLLAVLASVVAIWTVAKVLTGTDRIWELGAIGACVLVVVLTGSRTSLTALGVAVVAMLVRLTVVRLRTVALAALMIPLLTFLVLGTDLIGSLFQRGGAENVTSLSNRTIAWTAAVEMDRDGWQTWFGQGLAQKTVSVPGQWWDTQMLDSSWVSALVQGGYLGLALVAFLTVLTLGRALFAPRSKGPVWLGLILYLALGGFLESGLFDSSVSFMVFLVAALGVFETGHQRPSTAEPAGRPMAEAMSAGSGSAIVAS
jgi:capsular polysaccharide biosynthesis protein